MLATKNRAGGGISLILALAVLMTACSPPGPRALLKGKKLIEAGNYEAAAQELKTAIALMPTNAVAWNYLGLAYHRAGQGTNAAAAYNRALALNRELLEARFNLGCLWLEQDKLEAAKSELTAYTLRRSNAPEGWLKLGFVQLRAANPAAAEKSFREVIRLNSKNPEALNGLGLVQRQRGRAMEAAQLFEAALKQQPDYRPALLNLATVFQQDLNKPAEALRRYREYLALRPRAADWEAVNVLVQSFTQSTVPEPRPATNIIGQAAANTNKPPASVVNRSVPATKPVTNQLLAKSTPPPAPVESVKLPTEPVAKATVESSRTSAASPRTSVSTNPAVVPRSKVESSENFSQSNPAKRELLPLANETAAAAPGVKDSASDVEKEVPARADGRYPYQSPAIPPGTDRRTAERVLLSGQQAQNVGRLAEAIQAYRRAGQLDGSYFEAHYRLGLAAFEARSFRLALLAWETALAVQPDSADARYNFALTLKAANYPADAVAELEKLLALHPDEARGHLTLGNLYAEQFHDVVRARKHYGRVLQLDPRNPQAQVIRYWLVANPG